MARRVRILLLVVMVFVAAMAHGSFYNPPECELNGWDCWTCKNIGFLNPPFCWPLLGDNNRTGRCGCADLSPYGHCVLMGEFCGNIWVTP
ncbi:MAG: hypothetical protein BWX64_00037 [Acidobacteria bacterium ADurb.Bin051]|jgi:hypothetical protein|nr:MAG: hypothetical protein BWX64_00037 [Acidobacteria bacterium ADurb.Bin051]